MNLRPQTFFDWRELWHREAKYLGWHIAWLFGKNGRRIRIDRSTYRLLHRLKRIRARLDIEGIVRDETWAAAMYEMIFGDEV